MKSIIPMIAAGILAAGAMLGQSTQAPASSPAQTPGIGSYYHQSAGNLEDRTIQRLTAGLNLTTAQQAQVKVILRKSREETKSWAPEFRAERMALANAVKSDSLRWIDEITASNMSMNTEMAANHLKTVARIYAILTPSQKATFDQRLDRVMNSGQPIGHDAS